ncbi:MAG TPA: HAD-IA family hydrolase [Kineosporiaceae bacterium]|nr:HAD-IA family hydrolase [Kineosporiaceae bacterium]
MYRGILLDLYGTLVHDDEELLPPICTRVAERAAVDPAAVAREWFLRLHQEADLAHGEAFRTLADLNLGSLEGAAAHFGERVDARDLCREQMAFWRHPPLFGDSLPFLREVGIPVCLVSDADRDDVSAVVALRGITVEAIVTSQDARAYKPRAEPFRLALTRLGLDAREVLHVGDSPASDVAGAQALGIDTALVDRGGHRQLAGTRPTYVVESLTALLPRLSGP